MPKKTFYNLPNAKQGRIIEAAMDEFASHPYSDASVNRIIKGAGIAVGSFYQYFADLKDLYVHVLKIAIRKKHEFFKTELARLESRDFRSSVRAVYKAGIQFVFSDPRLHKINTYLITDRDPQVIQEISSCSESIEVDLLLEALIKDAIENGELRAEFSPSQILSIIMSLNLGFIENILQQQPEGLTEEDYNSLSEKVTDVLLNGLSANPKQN